MGIPQAKAKGLLLWWGRFRYVYGHASTYIAMVQMALIAAMAYNTTVQPWVTQYLGRSITFWQYCVVLTVILGAGMVLEFTLGVPSFLTTANEQWYKHGNPVKTNLDAVRAKQTEIERKIDKVMKHLGIDETGEKTGGKTE